MWRTAVKKVPGLEGFHFNRLRHTFCTVSLEHGMDVKTLSTVTGHVFSSTTLNVYAHVTNEMRWTAAVKIDQGIGKAESQTMAEIKPRKPAPSTFQAHKGQRRKAGTGCVTQINAKLWEGRYYPVWTDGQNTPKTSTPTARRNVKNLLVELIAGMKAKIRMEKARLKTNPKAG